MSNVKAGQNLNDGVEILYNPEEKAIVIIKEGNPVAGLNIDYLRNIIDQIEHQEDKVDK